MTDPRNVSPENQAAIDAVFTGLPTTYPHIEFQLGALYEAFRTKIAEALQPKLNEFLQGTELSSMHDYKKIAQYIDNTLTNLGLCLSIAGEPGVLIGEAELLGDNPHFAILTRRDGNPAYHLTPLPPGAPTLTLMAAPINIDYYLSPVRDRAYDMRGWGR
jgi:hypothetical protein